MIATSSQKHKNSMLKKIFAIGRSRTGVLLLAFCCLPIELRLLGEKEGFESGVKEAAAEAMQVISS